MSVCLVQRETLRVDDVEYMKVGEIGLAFPSVIAHAKSGELDPVSKVVIVTSVDVERYIDEVVVEKVQQGWLVNGILYPYVCYDVCHGGGYGY